jgi:hypothetical protein
MKNLMRATLFGLLSVVSAHAASGGRIVVECGDTHFSDLTKIQIQETELRGQYQIVENGTRLSLVFGMEALEKSEFPDLTSWNGYTRKLVRYGRDNYSISIQDECSGSTSSLSCQESL